MRFSAEHLRFKALVALDEAAEAETPVAKSFSLRFALAYLYACSSGERWMFDQFWQAVTEPCGEAYLDIFGRNQCIQLVTTAPVTIRLWPV